MRRRRAICGVFAAMVLWPGIAGLAAASSPSRPSGADSKRGIASARYLALDPARLTALGATWAYDWSATAPPRRRGLEWVPMLWGAGSVTPQVMAALRADRRAGRARYLLGFNEPDSASQSNLSPEHAAALWPQLERTGLALGSPAPAVATDGWLGRFMTLARQRHLEVDFLALHYYQDFTNPASVSDLRRQLLAIHKAYRKPIWITEIGAIDLRAWHEPMLRTPTEALATAYMHQLFAMLDRLPFVTRYAWFTDDCWNHPDCRFGSLFNARGLVTSAGRMFSTAP